MKHLRGFAIVSAMFILVVLAALGAFILNISTNQQIGSALDLQGVRAYQAARSGLDWGMFQVESTPAYNFSYGAVAASAAVGAANPNGRACPVSPTSFVPAAGTLAGFTVTVTCAVVVDANNGPTVFLLTSTACNQPNAGACPNILNPGNLYVERQLTVAF